MCGIAAEDFRLLMRCFASGVTVITTLREGIPHGMTATAFCSVSADPPTVLVAVNRSSRSHGFIAEGGRFGVNILAADQPHVGALFAGKDDHAFDRVAHALSPGGLPLLAGAAAHLDCVVCGTAEAATHTVYFGRVTHGARSSDAPLVYHDGRYRAVV